MWPNRLRFVSCPWWGARYILQCLLGSFCEHPNILSSFLVLLRDVQYHLVALKAYVLFSNSAVKVHGSQVCTNTTRECISFTFGPKDLLSFHIGFSFIRAAGTYAVLERNSGFEPSFYISNVHSFTLISLYQIDDKQREWYIRAVCHRFGIHSTCLCLYLEQVFPRLQTTTAHAVK